MTDFCIKFAFALFDIELKNRFSYKNLPDRILFVFTLKAEYAYETFRCKIKRELHVLRFVFAHFSGTN